MPTASSLAWKTSLRKVRTLWHCSRLRSVALTYDWSWWYPSGNRPLQQYLGFTAGRCWWSVRSTRLTAWLQNLKEAGGTVREIDVWAESPRLSPLWLSASSSACRGLLTTVITPLPTKPSATKMPGELEAGERGNYWHADASAWCCCAWCKIHEAELATQKLEWCLRDDVAAGRRRLHISSLPSVKLPPPPADNAASPDWQTPLNGLFHPQREADHYAKTTGRNPEVY